MYQTILFDLDGTLTDSGQGILNSVAYALEKMGIEEPDTANLNRFIGPPLYESFHDSTNSVLKIHKVQLMLSVSILKKKECLKINSILESSLCLKN